MKTIKETSDDVTSPKVEITKAARLIWVCFSAISETWRKALFVRLALFFYYLSPKHRLIALQNLKMAFPDKSMPELIYIAKGVYRNIGTVLAEFFKIPALTKQNIRQWVDVEGLENLENALKKNRGVLIFSAHLGNWELLAAAIAVLCKPSVVLYRRLDNPVLENLVLWVRSSTGNILLLKDGAMRSMLQYLKRNAAMGILIDQNMAWQEGVFVDFFGRPACTTEGIAFLALHTGAPVHSVFVIRRPDGSYRLIISKEVEIIQTGDQNADVRTNTQNFTKIVEDMVRQYPDQWLWVHQRWKTKDNQAG
jgi:KDO2-lipid IV(A) lauroyltransferase